MTKSVFSDRYSRLITRIVEARRRAGITQTALAQKLGKPQSYISKVERGERRLDVVETMDLAVALGVTINDLIESLDATDTH